MAQVNISNDFVPYLSALIDGEGTITAWKDIMPNGYTRINSNIMIYNTNEELMYYVANKLQTNICISHKSNLRHKACYQIKIPLLFIRMFSNQISHNLHGKRRQFRIFEFIDYLKKIRPQTKNNKDLLDIKHRILNNCIDCIHALNHRGII